MIKKIMAVLLMIMFALTLFASCDVKTSNDGEMTKQETGESSGIFNGEETTTPSESSDTEQDSESTNNESVDTEDEDDGSDTFRVAFGFVDNCVLQRDQKVRIYGEGGKAGKIVTVTFGDQVKSGKVASDGWEVYLDPMPATAEGKDLIVEYGSIKRTYENVVVGEVFLCSGQSNMSVSYNYILNKDATVEADYHTYNNYSNLRFLQVHVRDKIVDIKRLHHYWLTYDTVEDAQDMSALALSFASNLSAMLGNEVPIGIIHCSVPGSSIEAWLDQEAKNGLTHFSEGVSAWSCYYDAMLSGFDGYTVRAMLWYQGETDSEPHMVSEYGEKFSRFVNLVRRDNKNDELPIITFQLVQYKWVPWQEIRQIQFDAAHSIKNVYMVCGIDTGCNIPDNPSAFAADGIHDSQKWLYGRRAAGLAVSELLKMDYDSLAAKTSYGDMPYLSSAVKEGNTIVINIANATTLSKSEGELTFFEIYDGNSWKEVSASLKGNQIILSINGNVEKVRYLHDDVFPDGTAFIYNEYGNPVSPTTGISVT